ncbi:MAG: NUDIX hydrolase [Burkholderiales bacterium]|nr:NUDIX hydrolase [Burkholderiales bacterium]
MKFCSQCGSGKIESALPPGDDRAREICADCGYIHYVNPKVVVGSIPVWGEQILLCKRAIEPRYGKWTLPAGFMEEGETLAEGAKRETLEEAGARISIEQLYASYSLPEISQVYVLFLARLDDLNYLAGSESLEVKLFHEHEIPWDELAFVAISEALKRYFADRVKGSYTPHFSDLRRAKIR